MADKYPRRKFLAAVGTAVASPIVANAALAAPGQKANSIKIIGISCSPRKGKTTAAALKICLDVAKAVNPAITTQLIELAGLDIGIFNPNDPKASQGGFVDLIPVLSEPKVAAIIVGTPVYFGGMTSLCKGFLDHCMAFRQNNFALSGKVAGILAVGGARNGGQELAIQSVQAALLCQEMVIVGDGRPTGHFGATLVNSGNDDISSDEFGIATAKNLGRRVAEVALKIGAGQ